MYNTQLKLSSLPVKIIKLAHPKALELHLRDRHAVNVLIIKWHRAQSGELIRRRRKMSKKYCTPLKSEEIIKKNKTRLRKTPFPFSTYRRAAFQSNLINQSCTSSEIAIGRVGPVQNSHTNTYRRRGVCTYRERVIRDLYRSKVVNYFLEVTAWRADTRTHAAARHRPRSTEKKIINVKIN